MGRLYDIATANCRTAKKWQNRKITWEEMLDRLRNVVRTPERVSEYARMSRARKASVKDCGGFVGGYCENGDRKTVSHRSMLTLDADYADGKLWDDWCLLYGQAAAVYSTHSHTMTDPRYRLVIPLSRDVEPDEYQAIGRKVAADLGIDKFDDTTYQPQRLMYWPSCSFDGDYVCQHTDSVELLDADAVLASYTDWRDMSSWPMSKRVAEITRKRAEKQQDPTEKRGLVGAFCRKYTISDAIEKFIPAYEPAGDGRYTYTEGSTAAGLVVYEDKWAYSHHSTDPASGQLCNAWDLVRIHLFGEQDDGLDEDKPATKRPSYRAMMKLAQEDAELTAELVRESMEESEQDFEDLTQQEWTRKLQKTDKGSLCQSIKNVRIILNNDPHLQGRVRMDDFQHSLVVAGGLPWSKHEDTGRVWGNADDAQLRSYLEDVYKIRGESVISDALTVVAQDHAFHPVRDYLEACVWDGSPRVEELLIRYLGADDTPYTRAVTRKHMVASVARIMQPGCKYDQVLAIRGRQGIGKSTLISRLGVNWYSDTLSTVAGKEAYEQVQGVWQVEIGELAGMKKSEVEQTKLFISKHEDRFRPAYGRKTESYQRQCVFWATTNELQFLRDMTGNRRWWVVDTPNAPTASLWDELTPDTVRLIWAEAVELWRKGEQICYLPADLEAEARKIQTAFTEESAQTGLIEEYLDTLLPEDWWELDTHQRNDWLSIPSQEEEQGVIRRDTVSHMELWCEALKRRREDLDRYHIKELQGLMSQIEGWEYVKAKKRIFPYGIQRYYRRVE